MLFQWLIRGYVSSQGFLEQVIESVVEHTGITRISLRARLVFDCSNAVMLVGFSGTEDGLKLHPALLPSSDTLVAWVLRLKARHSQLTIFKLVIEYDTIDTDSEDLPENNEILQFEYREVKEDEDDHQQIFTRENMDLHSQPSEADDNRFRYQVYPSLIKACYDQLVQDAEALRQEEALGAADMQAGLLADNEAAGAPNRGGGAD
jgi:hypothetical protein